ncbi:MAG: carbohydrate ABC transporter permease [Christensenellales bacterium]|jgi:putative aldouronate transport system permease protein
MNGSVLHRKHGKIPRSRSDIVFDSLNMTLTLILGLVLVYPLYFIVIASVSDPFAVYYGKVVLAPSGFTLDAYKNVFRYDDVWVGYRNTILYTAGGTLYSLLLTIPAAYVLSRRDLPLKTLISWYFFITMYFSGGMVPTYLLYKDLSLINTRWALIIGPGVSCYNLIVCRTYFSSSLPEEIHEAAIIDGANEFRFFVQMVLPLSSAIIAVMALFHGVFHWNSYFRAMIYITKKNLYPLQLVLRNILILNQLATSGASQSLTDVELMAEAAHQAYMANSMKYSLIIVSTLPLLVAYPFVQKFFVTGIMIGSVKG